MSAWNKSDLQVTNKYDLIFRKDRDNHYVAKTNVTTPAHTLAQVLYLCLQTLPGEFKLSKMFGSSPKGFRGQKISASLLTEIENFISNHVKKSDINPDNFPLLVKAALISRDNIAIQVALTHPRTGEHMVKINMLYSVNDNTINPIYNVYGSK